jgi:hypothetical protein
MVVLEEDICKASDEGPLSQHSDQQRNGGPVGGSRCPEREWDPPPPAYSSAQETSPLLASPNLVEERSRPKQDTCTRFSSTSVLVFVILPLSAILSLSLLLRSSRGEQAGPNLPVRAFVFVEPCVIIILVVDSR